MQLPALLITDLHLVDSASASYRFGVFPWLKQVIADEGVKTLVVMGDVTDAKDGHKASLVNRIVKEFADLSKSGVRILILCGNHDWLLKGQEFFKFLNVLPNVKFITEPWEDDDLNGGPAFFLPYSKSPATDWKGFDLSHYRYVFMHQTIKGAVASNGQRMDGEDLPDLSAAQKIYSGDIHVPQVIGPIEYVGSPYHVHFGDNFKPRCVLLERDGNPVNLYFKTIKRVALTVESVDEIEAHNLRSGDHVKLNVKLADSEKHEWSRVKREVAAALDAAGVEVHGIKLVSKSEVKALGVLPRAASYTPRESVIRFAQREELNGDALELALEIIENGI